MNAGQSRLLRGSIAVTACLGVAFAGACARQGAPPGGPEDRRPPVVVRTEPDTFATIDDARAKVVFRFDERISERVEGSLDEAVMVSPATGAVRVGMGRRSLTVEIEGGFKPGLVYRVTLLPAVGDLFGNQMRDPFELVFSTGGELSPYTVAGLVWDRITGDGVDAVEVRAMPDGVDSVVHVARTDDEGVYALRYLPPGRYRFVAFQDRNRDGIVDAMENQGSGGLVLGPGADTVLLPIAMLVPDTSAARVTGTQLLDSVTVVLELDDYLDPEVSLENVGATLTTDSGSVPGVVGLYHEHEYRAFVEAVSDSFSRLDSLDALVRSAEAAAAASQDATAADTAQALDTIPDPDTARVRRTGRSRTEGDPPVEPAPQEVIPSRRPPPSLAGVGGRERPPRPDGSLPPTRRLVLVLSEGLVPNQAYTLTVDGVANISAVPQGGGEAALILAPPPDTTSVAEDSTLVDDTLVAPPDTGSVGVRPADLFRPRRRE